MGDTSNAVNEKYMAMRNAESKKALEWMSLYNSNPELAASIMPIFAMPEEDIRFIMRTLNSLYDTLYFYKLAIKSSGSKKKSGPNKVTFVSV